VGTPADFPDFTKSREDLRTSQFIIANQQGEPGEDLTFGIAEGARWATNGMLEGQEVHDIPSGTVWNLSAGQSGELSGGVLFNLDEFDESTVAGWPPACGGFWPAPSASLTGTGGCSPVPPRDTKPARRPGAT